VDPIDKENWWVMSADAKGNAYDGEELASRDKANRAIFFPKEEKWSMRFRCSA
jgi:hypothetical protein